MGFCAPCESGWAVVVGPAVLGRARRPGRNGTMGDLATKQSNWVRLFNVANEFDSWGQIAEAEENYVKVISQIQSDRAEWTTGTVSRFDNVSRLATLRVANRWTSELSQAYPALSARSQELLDKTLACIAARVKVCRRPSPGCRFSCVSGS